MRWRYVALLALLLALAGAGAASAGWVERQLGEWHDMSYCSPRAPAPSVGHRWRWRVGWPPGRWTCVYRDRRGNVVDTRPVR